MVKVVARKTIYKSSTYIYFLLKALGMAFYSHDKKLKCFKVSCWHYLGLLLSIFYWIFQSILHRKTEIYYTSGLDFKIVENIWRRVFEFQIFAIIPIILFNFVKRKHVEKFLQLIEKFDTQMEFLEWKNDVEFSRTIEILPFIPIAVLICNYAMLINFEWSEILFVYPPFVYHIKFLAYLVIMETFFIISFLFVVSCWCVSRRLRNLMENMR